MGTLPIITIKGFRLRILPAENGKDHHHLAQFPVLVFVITLMIGMQAPMISCSGNVNLARPYLFRDYEMMTGYAPHHSSRLPTLFQHQQQQQPRQKSSAAEQYSDTDSVEDGSSEESEDTQQYTAPLILDIDDPEVRARWMGFSDHPHSFEEEYDEEFEDDVEEEQRSLSSTEFQSRSSQQIRVNSGEQQSDNGKEASAGSDNSGSSSTGEKSRGIMDNFSLNPFSFWQGERDDDLEGQDAELPQSDEYGYHPYYDYYDSGYSGGDAQQHDQKRKPIMPEMVPMQMTPKQKPKPKPKPKPKKPKPKPKPMHQPGMMMQPKPMRVKTKAPEYSQQFHYQEFEKPGKLAVISDKLSKLNPFRYVHLQKPQIKIEKNPEDMPPHRHPPHGPPPRGPPPKKMKKPKRRPQNRPPMKPKPPSMMQAMMNKIKPKSPKPMPKQKQPKPKKPQDDESNPEFVMIFGEPFGDFSSSEIKGMEGREDDDEEDGDDDNNDDEDEEEDEEEDGDDEDEEDDQIPQVTSITHGELPSGEMTDGEAVVAGDDGDEADAENNQDEPVLLEDDEGDYEDGVIGLSGSYSGTGADTRPEDADQREKSLSIKKLFGWRKKKRRRHRPHKRVPARKPPHWKQYRPAPLLPEIPEGVSDALLKVVKNVGFLPEYDKIEKYGGHNKIKGKFTKTRPITLHHGLLTEVLRRR